MRGGLTVLMTADTVGGVFTYACELAEGLRPHGVTIALATMGAPLRPAQARTLAALSNVEVFETSFALEWMPDPWVDVDAAGDWLMAIASLVRPHVVHINGYAHAALPFDAPVVAVAHSCVCSWHRAVRGREAGPEWAEYRRRAVAGLEAAAITVAPTAAIARDILGALGTSVPTRVIPNGRAFDVPSSNPITKESFVLAAGRMWDEAKGLDVLEACTHSLVWPVRVAGPTAPPVAMAGGRAARIESLGELDPPELARWMSRASIFAHPARYEPFGLAVLEAALSGCALALSDLPSLREVWGNAAVYAPPGDAPAFARVIDTLIRDPLRRTAIAHKARERARMLTPARMAASYLALYTQLAAASREACA